MRKCFCWAKEIGNWSHEENPCTDTHTPLPVTLRKCYTAIYPPKISCSTTYRTPRVQLDSSNDLCMVASVLQWSCVCQQEARGCPCGLVGSSCANLMVSRAVMTPVVPALRLEGPVSIPVFDFLWLALAFPDFPHMVSFGWKRNRSW